ncbi:hypothetical protein MTS1_00194 [Microbacterium sp. TS-1]|nr:hypothetical protein MTS1_00194 [Microbacterium sp. TS-1]
MSYTGPGRWITKEVGTIVRINSATREKDTAQSPAREARLMRRRGAGTGAFSSKSDTCCFLIPVVRDRRKRTRSVRAVRRGRAASVERELTALLKGA